MKPVYNNIIATIRLIFKQIFYLDTCIKFEKIDIFKFVKGKKNHPQFSWPQSIEDP